MPQPANLDEKQIVLFSFPKSDSGPNALCGSFERVEASAHTKSDDGYKMYFMVEDDQKTAEVCLALLGIFPRPSPLRGFEVKGEKKKRKSS